MAARFEAQMHHGEPLMVDHTPVAAVAAGEVVTVGNEFRIAHNDIPANKLGALAAPGGNAVYAFAKGATAFSDGDTIFWNDSLKQATTGPADGVIGVCVQDAAAGDDIVYARHERAAVA